MKWVRSTSTPVYDLGGNLLMYDSVVKDITKEKVFEEGPKSMEVRFENIFDAISEGAFVVSKNGIIIKINSAALRLMNIEYDVIINTPFYLFWNNLCREIGPPSTRDETPVALVTKEKKAVNDFIFKIEIRDMPVVWISMNTIPVELEKDPCALVLVTFTDITERIEHAREAHRLRKLIEKLESKVVQGFITTCSNCRRIIDQDGKWVSLEEFLSSHTGAEFSHGICPSCGVKYHPEL
jgi:PAS domain-containing protein